MKKVELPQKSKPSLTSKQPKMNMDSGNAGDGAAVDIGAPQIASDVSLRGLGLGAAPSDRELTRLYALRLSIHRVLKKRVLRVGLLLNLL